MGSETMKTPKFGFLPIRKRPTKGLAFLIIFCLLGAGTHTASADVFEADSYIINTGVVPQTATNSTQIYGMLHDLIDNQVPVYWVIDELKAKDGADFTVDGINFAGGPFIVPGEFAPLAAPIVATWTGLGVSVHQATVSFTAPANGSARELTYNPYVVATDGAITNNFFFSKSGMPATSRRFAPDNVFAAPTAEKGGTGGIGRCEDILAIPHNNPDEWPADEARRLSCFLDINNSAGGTDFCNNAFLAAGGGTYSREQSGHLWAACHSPSEIEAAPIDGGLGLNFLTTTTQFHHDEAPPAALVPFSYPASQGGTNVNAQTVMQFMGTADNSLTGGSQDLYFPKTTSWRTSTIVGITDPDVTFVGSPPPNAIVAFGDAYGETENGFVTYEGSHDLLGGTAAEEAAAARIFGNFILESSLRLQPTIDTVSLDSLSDFVIGSNNQLSVTMPMGTGPYTYEWSNTCGGSFDDNTSATPIFTAPSSATNCFISVLVSDDCGRSTFSTHATVVDSVDVSVVKSASPDPVKSGEQLTFTLTVTNSAMSALDAPDVEVTDVLPEEVTWVSTTNSNGGGTCTAGNLAACNCSSPGNTGTVSCQLGTIAIGASRTVDIVTTVD